MGFSVSIGFHRVSGFHGFVTKLLSWAPAFLQGLGGVRRVYLVRLWTVAPGVHGHSSCVYGTRNSHKSVFSMLLFDAHTRMNQFQCFRVGMGACSAQTG